GRDHHDHRRPHRQAGDGAARARHDPVVCAPGARSGPAGLRPGLHVDGELLVDHHAGRRRCRDPALPGLPDRAARRVLHVPRGRLPPAPRRAADEGPVRGLAPRGDHPHLRAREGQELHRRLPLRRPPHGRAGVDRGRAVDVLPRRQEHLRRVEPDEAGDPPHRQDADARRLRPPLQRRPALRLPGQQPRLRVELPVDDVPDGRAPLRRQPRPGQGPRRAVHPPRRPRAELLDHRHAHGRLQPGRPLQRHRRSGRRALRSPPRRGQRGRHPDAPAHRQRRPGPRLHRVREAGRGSPHGLRSPGLQELRPPGDDREADGRRGVRDHRVEPVARHRPPARVGRPVGRLLHRAQAVPQRGLLLRPDLPGHGLPARDVHGALRHPPDVGLAGALDRAPRRQGAEDRPPPPEVRRRRGAPLRAPRRPL
ncbi:MAG: Citrate synthase (si), partial [uncultured Acidimicrobiales bacterium]